MAAVNQKRKVLSMEEKVNIIRKIENGQKKAEVCRELGMVSSSVQTIWKNREKIVGAFKRNGSRIKRLRKPTRSDVDEALLKWLEQKRDENLPLSRPLLMAKAEELSRLLGDQYFVCTNGWIDRFRLRYNVPCGKVKNESNIVSSCKNESNTVSCVTTSEWLQSFWPKVRQGYKDCDVYNAQEMALFYRLTPDKVLKLIGEKCMDGKFANERITLLVCANLSGTEKRKLLVIGRTINPMCLRNIKCLPVQYSANTKAWMTLDLFERELRLWDEQLQLQKKNILLLVEKCPSHPMLENLQNIKLVFLKTKTVSSLQPMDHGVIKNLKSRFRKMILLRTIERIENNQNHNITLLDAIQFVEKAWRKVSQKTIVNSFNHAGIKSENLDVESGEKNPKDEMEDEDDNMPLSEWVCKVDLDILTSYDLDSYAVVDDGVITTEIQTDEDIVQEIRNKEEREITEPEVVFQEEEEEEEEVEEDEAPVPTLNEALDAIRSVNRFYQARAGSNNIVSVITNIEDDLERLYLSRRKQKRFFDVFVG